MPPFGDDKADVLMLGMEGSGKSLLTRRMIGMSKSGGKVEALNASTVPTVGVEMQQVQQGKVSAVIREVGGSMLPVWHNYFAECGALCYVVDVAGLGHVASAAMEFLQLLAEPKLDGKPVLLLLNKQDMPCILTRPEVESVMRLRDVRRELREGRLTVMECSALTGAGVTEATAWVFAHSAATKDKPPKRGGNQRDEGW